MIYIGEVNFNWNLSIPQQNKNPPKKFSTKAEKDDEKGHRSNAIYFLSP